MKRSTAISLGLGAAAVTATGAALWKLSRSLYNVHRVDDQGALYYAEYRGNYYDPLLRLPVSLFRAGGCSSFFCRSDRGELLSCRNYDLPHRDKEGRSTGLNVILRCHPKGKYASLGVADAAWLSKINLPYTMGALDGPKILRSPTALLPWLTMDGINEKGLVLSVHALDLKDGEEPVHQRNEGRETVCVTELLRYGLDECADVEEFLALADSVDMHHILKADFHVFATDAAGNAAVLEWRCNELYVVRQDAVTNFYTCADDAGDVYWKGKLKERFARPPKTERTYRYGFGHGYGRFFTLAESLCAHGSTEDSLATFSEEEATSLLEAVSQAFDGSDVTSCTQYSAIYHHDALSLVLFSMRDYERQYRFTL